MAPGEDDDAIDFWLVVHRDPTQPAEVREQAAAKLDELLRAPAWPS